MMVMVVGFAYKLGKRERGWLVDESSRKRFGEGPEGFMRKMCVFLSLTPIWPFLFFIYIIF